MNSKELYTEEEILEIVGYLNYLMGKILLDEKENFFLLKDFHTKSTTIEDVNLFKANEEYTAFYIDKIVLTGDAKEYVHYEDAMCSVQGVNRLMKCHENYTVLQNKLTTFTIKNKFNLKFG